MGRKPKTTEVALIGKSVPDVLTALSAKLAGLTKITECPYKTSGNLDGFGDIKSETKVENLIRAFSAVRGKERAYNEAAIELGLQQYPVFSISGGNAADWKQDILLRKAVIEHSDTEKKLKELTEKAKSFLTQSDQYAIFLQEAGTMLSALGI